jgi:hypothetical protein
LVGRFIVGFDPLDEFLKSSATAPKVSNLTNSPKQPLDLPQFTVKTVNPTKAKQNEVTEFEIGGIFDGINGVHGGGAWLLLPERECLQGTLRLEDSNPTAGSFLTSDQLIPKFDGFKFSVFARALGSGPRLDSHLSHCGYGTSSYLKRATPLRAKSTGRTYQSSTVKK